ncbi:hypothetical protein HS125_01410 [bacterium]|nr:hypothetical protein [bacterium]
MYILHSHHAPGVRRTSPTWWPEAHHSHAPRHRPRPGGARAALLRAGKTDRPHPSPRFSIAPHPATANPATNAPATNSARNRHRRNRDRRPPATTLNDYIRDLCEQVRFPPGVSRFKVYINDEVHMLSMGAFNALLKTLEEPPDYVRFVMATTELHKVPATILSRCQKYRFRPIPLAEMVDNLKRVIGPEGLSRLAPDEAEQVLYYVSRSAQGSLRDAQSTLDQVLALSSDKVRYRDVEELLGMVELDALAALFDCVAERKTNELLDLVDRLLSEGKDAQQLVRDLENYIRNLLVAKHHPSPAHLLELPPDLAERVIQQAKRFEVGSLLSISELLWDLEARMRWSAEARLMLEVALLKAVRLAESASLDRLLDRLAELEQRLGGAPTPPPTRPPAQSEPATPSPRKEPATPARDAAAGEAQLPLLSEIRDAWPALAAAIANSRVAGCLADAQPVRFEGSQLVLEIPKGYAFYMDTLKSPEARRALDEAMRARWGRSIPVVLEFGSEAPAAPVRETGAAQAEEPLDPAVQKTLELFSGKIVKTSRKA